MNSGPPIEVLIFLIIPLGVIMWTVVICAVYSAIRWIQGKGDWR